MDEESYNLLRLRLVENIQATGSNEDVIPAEMISEMISITKETDSFAYVDVADVFDEGSRVRVTMRDGEQFDGTLIRFATVSILSGIVIKMDDNTIRVVQETEYKYLDLIGLSRGMEYDRVMALRKKFVKHVQTPKGNNFG
jgi:hypothetical protein